MAALGSKQQAAILALVMFLQQICGVESSEVVVYERTRRYSYKDGGIMLLVTIILVMTWALWINRRGRSSPQKILADMEVQTDWLW